MRRSFHDVSMEEVARSAGVAKGTLFLYFRSKEELVGAAYSDLFEEMGEALEHAARSPLRGRALVEEAARAILWEFDRNRDFLSQIGPGGMRGCGPASADHFRSLIRRNTGYMKVILARCAQEGLIARGRSLDMQAAFLFGLCRAVLFRQNFLGQRAPLARRAREVTSQFIDGARGRR